MKAKKTLVQIMIIFIVSIILTGCFSDNDSIEDAKKKLGVGTDNSNIETNIKNQDTTKENNDINVVNIDNSDKVDLSKTNFTIEKITQEQFLEIDDLTRKVADLQAKDLSDLKLIITGKTKLEVDKITVSFKNNDSSFPNDPDYKLGKFNSGDLGFTYNASSKFKVLDYGVNEYLFKAYSGDSISELLLKVTINKKLENTEENIIDNNNSVDNISQQLILTKITDNAGEVTCDGITNYLTEKINTWYYRNTCRDIIEDKAIGFFVIRLDGDHYVYEKHYIDYINNKYGVLLLEDNIEKGDGEVKDDIKAKNNEYKEKNDSYEGVEKADKFIKESL